MPDVGALRLQTIAAHRALVAEPASKKPRLANPAGGAGDGDVVLIDVVAERASHRLVGHRAAVTDLCCLGDWAAGSDGRRLVASTSRDGLIKVWDARLQHCIQTITGAGGGVAVRSLAFPSAKYIDTGASSSLLSRRTVTL